MSAALVSALAAGLLLTASARAATLEVPQGAGLTTPGGLAETPDGALWATDAVRGVCRLRTGGANPAPVESRFCVAPVEEGPQGEGPKAPFQMAFDPETSYFYVAEGSSASGGVWRMRWNPLNGAIDTATKIADTPDDRVFALALGRTGPPLVPAGPLTNEVYFATKDSDAIRKVANPSGLVPTVQPFGFAQRSGSSSLAWLEGQLYIADGSLVTRISTAAGASPNATPMTALAVAFPSVLAADQARGRLYVGTDSGAFNDRVYVLVPAGGVAESYDSGFAGISALAVGGEGSLLVGDDPVAASGAIGAEGNGRVWRAPLSAVNLPGVAITDGPPTYTNQRSATFSYSSRTGATFECRLDGSAWKQCPGETEGTKTYDGLAEGTHDFEVRGVDATGPGRSAQRTFVVDTTAPDATIDNPDSDRTVRGDSLALNFSSGETQASFTCSLDGAPPAPCRAPRRYTGLALGEHNVRVSATDPAGNTSDPADPRAAFAFTVEPAPAPASVPEAPGHGSGGPPPAGGPLARDRVALDALAGLRPTLAMLPAPRLSRRALLRNRLVRVAFDAPAQARFARVTVQRHSAKTSLNGARSIATRRFQIDAGRRNRLALRLTAAEARRLSSPGRYRVTVEVGVSSGSFGPAKALILRVLRGR